ncbi:fasciclin domain-containing protein [uncultured Dokdonia sp.]|uniref:fasciclin domain-containing protein n=1 Tax=uncultured Dokdonia sp. TaxID=575653 RepID=UPI00262E8821|nr:fasciclin domain-containing protein [uncultured Dokdonia sp.]
MKKTILIFAMLTFCFSTVSIAQSDVVDVAMSSKDHTTLVAAVKAADLVNTLKGEGPFTVFAPTNTAFDALPSGTLESLLKPEAKSKLSAILTYHVVAGNFKAADVVAAIKQGGGKFAIKTVNGGTLVASLEGDNVIITDANGNVATVTATDLKASNGVVHVIDSVVLPK